MWGCRMGRNCSCTVLTRRGGKGRVAIIFDGPAALCWAAHDEITKIIGFYFRSTLSSISLYIDTASLLRNSCMQVSFVFLQLQ